MSLSGVQPLIIFDGQPLIIFGGQPLIIFGGQPLIIFDGQPLTLHRRSGDQEIRKEMGLTTV